jgi:membrane-associated protease RseP (regulator of RpoE activity)
MSDIQPETDVLTPIVSRVLKIEDLTWGDPKKDFIVRYRGRLYNEDTAAAYDQLAEALRPMEITPLFRWDGKQHAVLLMKGIIKPKESKIWVNILLFVLTVISVIVAGAINAYQGPEPSDPTELAYNLLLSIWRGLPFAICLLAILLAHEFGHYLAARHHKTRVSLPYFIPFPLSLFGTMGAFINIKELPRNRRHMLDIGLTGPLAGLVVAIPILLLGISLSKVEPLPRSVPAEQGFMLEGNSALYLLAKYAIKGELLPQPAEAPPQPLMYWLQYIFTGTPLPWGGRDMMMHPIAWAGWAGLLVTALNLIPAGQLDGGHVMYVLMGKKAARFVPFIIGALFLLGFAWSGWWLWAFLILILGRVYMEPMDLITSLDPPRKLMAVVGIIMFFLVFTPVPLIQVFGM